jgi:hypothetical protein
MVQVMHVISSVVLQYKHYHRTLLVCVLKPAHAVQAFYSSLCSCGMAEEVQSMAGDAAGLCCSWCNASLLRLLTVLNMDFRMQSYGVRV